jgi:hypothetical protein
MGNEKVTSSGNFKYCSPDRHILYRAENNYIPDLFIPTFSFLICPFAERKYREVSRHRFLILAVSVVINCFYHKRGA